jgi:integrase
LLYLVFERPVDADSSIKPHCGLLRVVQCGAAKAGLAQVDAHTLRHSFATALTEGGVPVKMMTDLLGHSSISITGDIYGHSTD